MALDDPGHVIGPPPPDVRPLVTNQGVDRAVPLVADQSSRQLDVSVTELGGSSWRRFRVAAVLSAVAALLFLGWTVFQIGGSTVTVAVDDYGEAAAALAAALSCAVASRSKSGRFRWVWGLLGASAACWAVGELIWAVQEVGMGIAVPFPSAADVGYLAALPLAVGAVLSLPSAPDRLATRGGAVLDGLTVALSLLFIGWVLGLDRLYTASPEEPLAQGIGVAYPLGDIVVVTVLLLAIRRTRGSVRGGTLLLVGGLAAIAIADSAFAFLTVSGSYEAIGSPLDTGWVVGYLLIALSTTWPSDPSDVPVEQGPVPFWQLAIPSAALVAAAIAAVVLTTTGHGLDLFLTRLIAAVALLLVATNLVAHKDVLRLLQRSNRAEAASRQAELELRYRTILLNQVIAQAPIGIVRADTHLIVIDANPGLGVLLRQPAESIIGSSLTSFVSQDDALPVLDRLRALSGGSATAVEVNSELNSPDGTRTWCHWNVTMVRNAKGEPDYYLAMITDATAYRQAQDAAMRNLAHLERLSRLKSEFMSSVSHEFRTALTGIQGFSEVMRDEVISPDEVKEMAGDIHADAERLGRMITEMLDLDRIESGRFTLHLETLDLNVLVEQAVARTRVSSAKHTITTDLTSDLPRVMGDSDRLIQVLANLLSNAVKYSPQGGEILVTTQVDGAAVRVGVRDHGQGIPPEFADRLFGRYERFEGTSNKTIGTGLGLAISRQIVELHKGRIWVTSEVGSGSEFSFTIPISRAGATQVQG